MGEKVFQKRLMRLSILMGLISLLLVAGSSVVLISMQKVQEESYEAMIHSYLNEYRINIQKQFHSDFETLETLASFIESGRIDLQDIIYNDKLTKNGVDTQFFRIGYYVKGNIEESVVEAGKEEYRFKNLPKKLKDAIRITWKGKEVISEVYHNPYTKKKVIGFSIPVVNDEDAVIGALVGVKNTDVIQELLDRALSMNIRMDIDWIEKDGTFVTKPEENIPGETMENLFDGTYITEQDKQTINKAMEKHESTEVVFTYDGVEYPLHVLPLDYNGWYIVYADKGNGPHSPIYSTFIFSMTAFGIVLVFMLLVIILASRYVRKSGKELIALSDYDSLTGLYNLYRFQQEGAQLLSETTGYAMTVCNLRHFQYINEIFGSQQADAFLCEIAKLLKSSLKEDECCCRYAADQFYMLLKMENEEALKHRLHELMEQITLIPKRYKRNYQVLVYAGVSIDDADGKSEQQRLQEMQHKAEFAMKHARLEHENVITFYDESMHEQENLSNQMESKMKKALKNNEFHLYLQPKKHLETNEIRGAEALVRWIQEDGKMIYPDQFIPFFEKNGFCARLDLYMVEKVCQKLREWMDEGKKVFPISVNQSKVLFYKSNYIESLCSITEKYQIPRHLIILEIIEGLAAENMKELNQTIQKLQKEGFSISLDDFGTGYSSLNVLAGIRIDELKLDRTFLMQRVVDRQKEQTIMLKNIVRLAKDLHIRTVAEGVETEENESFLREIGCDYGQGYYYSRPISAEEFTVRFLEEQKGISAVEE